MNEQQHFLNLFRTLEVGAMFDFSKTDLQNIQQKKNDLVLLCSEIMAILAFKCFKKLEMQLSCTKIY